MSCIAIIPARGGSVRIPRKNIRAFCGKPIIEYSIQTAIASCLFDDIYVSTDDDEIEKVATSAGAKVMRREVDDGQKGTQEVARDLLEKLSNLPDYVCVIYATSPLLLPQDLHDGLRALKKGPGRVFSMSVGDSPLADAGGYYWGLPGAFLFNVPLIGPNTSMVPLPPERICDINTLADWSTATYLYQALRRAQP